MKEVIQDYSWVKPEDIRRDNMDEILPLVRHIKGEQRERIQSRLDQLNEDAIRAYRERLNHER